MWVCVRGVRVNVCARVNAGVKEEGARISCFSGIMYCGVVYTRVRLYSATWLPTTTAVTHTPLCNVCASC